MYQAPLITIAFTDSNGNAVEKDVRTLGYTQPRLVKRWNAGATFTCWKPGAVPGAVPDIPFESQVAIYYNRQGAPGNYSKGTRIFYGRRIKRRSSARTQHTGDTLTFQDAIAYDLARLTLQDIWNVQAQGAPNLAPQYYSRIILFQGINADGSWGYITADQQIANIVTFAATQPQGVNAVKLQVGKLDPVWNMPIYPIRAQSCLDALRICLRSIPDAVMWIDYTTNDPAGNPLPTFNVTQRPNCTPITLPFATKDASGRSHVMADITERPDLQPPAIVFQYQMTNQFGNYAWTSFFVDAWPLGSNGLQLRAAVIPIDLRGANTQETTGYITSTNFNPTQIAFWQAKKSDLAAPHVFNLSIVDTSINDNTKPNGIKIADNSGNLLSPQQLAQYKYEYIDGSASAWMKDKNGNPIQILECVISARATYQSNDPRTATAANPAGTRLDKAADTHPVTTRIKLTNSGPNPGGGATVYESTSSAAQPEIPPANLAHNIWTSLQPLQYELSYMHVEDQVSAILGPEFVLNLTGPGAQAAWANMNAVIEQVDIDFFRGETRIECGPFKHLSEKEFFDLLMMWRIRVVYDNPAIRSSGQDSSTLGVQLSTAAPKEDTNASSVPPLTYHSVATPPDANGNQTVLYHDAGAQQFGIATMTNGTINDGKPRLLIDTSILPPSDLISGKAAVPLVKLVRIAWYTDKTCTTQQHAWVLMTQAFDGA